MNNFRGAKKMFLFTEKSKHVEELIHQYFEGLVKDIQTVDSVISNN
jgi:hypothetical protein